MDDSAPTLDQDTWDAWLGGVPLPDLAASLGTDVAALRRALGRGAPAGRRPGELVIQDGMALWVAAEGLPDVNDMRCPCVFLRTPRAYPPHHIDRALATMAAAVARLVPGAALDATVVESTDRDTCDGMQEIGYLVFAMNEDGDAVPAPPPGSVAT